MCMCREHNLHRTHVHFPRTLFLHHRASLQEGCVCIGRHVHHFAITDPIIHFLGKCLQALGLITMIVGVLVLIACTVATVLKNV